MYGVVDKNFMYFSEGIDEDDIEQAAHIYEIYLYGEMGDEETH